MEEKTLGVLGGVGPLATIYFADLVVKMTDAKTDQEHISMVILNHGAIPDRTDYILDHSKPNPLPVMIADAKKLQAAGCDYIVIPCNTAHYFYVFLENLLMDFVITRSIFPSSQSFRSASSPSRFSPFVPETPSS